MINDKVTAVCQDSRGFIWIGTESGLQRFDGTRYKNYVADVRDTTALQTDWISAIFEDNKKRLWIGTDHGAPYLLDRLTGTFYNYNRYAPAGKKINGIWNFTQDKSGAIWLAAHDGFYRLNEKTNQFENYDSKLGLAKNVKAGYLTSDTAGHLWMATTEGVKMYDQFQNKLYDKNNNPQRWALFDIPDGIVNIVLNNDLIWVSAGFNRRIYQFAPRTAQLKTFVFKKTDAQKFGDALTTENVGEISGLRDGSIIVPLLSRGLAFYQPSADSFLIVNTDNTKDYTYHENVNVNNKVTIFQDREDNILIANESGINMMNPGKRYFTSYRSEPTSQGYFPEAPASDFLQLKNGDILISYYNANGGIVRTDSNLQFKKHFLLNTDERLNLFRNQLWSLFQDRNGIVWAPNQRNTIFKFDPQAEKITEDEDPALAGPIIAIRQDEKDNIWLAHWRNGLIKLEASTGQKKNYAAFLYSDPGNVKRIQSLLIEPDHIWVGTLQNGLQLFDIQKEKFTQAYLVNEKDPASISSNSITDILNYNQDTLVLATEMGVNIFDKKRKTFRSITVREGLPNNIVIAVMRDEKGDIWSACSSGGFCKINMQDLTVTSYGINDGITDNVFGSRFYPLRNGKVLIGVGNGFMSFDPKKITAAAAPPDVQVTGIQVFGKEQLVEPLLNNGRSLKLSYKENSLRIDFASLQYWLPESIRYYYKLNGVDNDWILADKNHVAIYNQLKDGNYSFEVRCANREGVFCLHTTKFKILIRPPFWKRWWFITGCIVFTLLVLYRVIKWRDNNFKAIETEKRKVQQAQVEMYSISNQLSKAKLEALRSQMNPHFIFNSLNAIQECILTNKVDAAYEYLSKFSKLQRMVLADSEKELIPVSSEIEMLRLYLSLESLRFSQSFTYTIDISGLRDPEEIMIPSLITQPFVENAIWHGLRNKADEKRLMISFRETGDLLIIEIDDNGVGRAAAAEIKKQKMNVSQYDSKGTELSANRIALINQQYKADIRLTYTDKKDSSGFATGTFVEITIPLNLSPLNRQL